MSEERKYGTTRTYQQIFLLSLASLGVYYLFYLYWNFKDLEEHYQKAYDHEKMASPTHNNSLTMFLFIFVFPIYSIYKKYQLLHDHIDTSAIKSKPNAPSGLIALLVFIFGPLTLGIWPIMNEIKWQKAMNSHILEHANEQ
ncbi:MAG: hypothetical protein GF308_19385 [Candidatus Heimdallarchaeota archaeon]|nr:hypothetical protein [Candidatus Heimdallarchaeota archaeon]